MGYLSLLGISVLSLIPILFWFYIYVDRDSRTSDQLKLLAATFAYGILAVIPFLILRKYFFQDPSYNFIVRLRTEIPNSYLAAFLTYGAVALLEEYIKHFGFIMVVERSIFRLKKVIQGIEFSIASGMGFAFVENIVYLSSILQHGGLTTEFLGVFAIRSIGATLAHTVFSGLFGYFYARARLLPQAVITEEPSWNNLNRVLWQGIKFELHRAHLILTRQAPKVYDRSNQIFIGFMFAVLFHLAYNFLISIEIFDRNLTFLTIPLIFLALIFLVNRRKLWINRRIIRTFEAFVEEGLVEAKQNCAHLPRSLKCEELKRLLKHYDAHVIEGILNESGRKYKKRSILRRLNEEFLDLHLKT